MILNTSQKVALSIEPKTQSGAKARIDGVPEWSVDNASVITLNVATDGLTATALSTGEVGSAQVNVKVDANLGQGVRELTGLLDLTVISVEDEATTVEITTGTPEAR